MTTFVRGRTVKTAEALVVVDAGLAVGTHRFQLVVVTGDGRHSAPDVVDVVVIRRQQISLLRPTVTAVITPRAPDTPHPRRKTPARKRAKPRSET